MTREELIAKVYELCGWDVSIDDAAGYLLGERGGGWLLSDEVGLDDFVRDIVPVLNERGYEVALPEQFGARWKARLFPPSPITPSSIRVARSTDPVEAAFAVALEVLGD